MSTLMPTLCCRLLRSLDKSSGTLEGLQYFDWSTLQVVVPNSSRAVPCRRWGSELRVGLALSTF